MERCSKTHFQVVARATFAVTTFYKTHKNDSIPGSQGSTGSTGNGPRTAARHPPPTRAGGQDDVSLDKLLQISIYLYMYIYKYYTYVCVYKLMLYVYMVICVITLHVLEQLGMYKLLFFSCSTCLQQSSAVN